MKDWYFHFDWTWIFSWCVGRSVAGFLQIQDRLRPRMAKLSGIKYNATASSTSPCLIEGSRLLPCLLQLHCQVHVSAFLDLCIFVSRIAYCVLTFHQSGSVHLIPNWQQNTVTVCLKCPVVGFRCTATSWQTVYFFSCLSPSIFWHMPFGLVSE